MSYTHITSNQRNELSALLTANVKQSKICEILNKDRTTIWREKQRGKANTQSGYSAKVAKKNAHQNRINSNKRFKKIKNSKWIRNYVVKKIKSYWSPEQIAGRIKKLWPDDKSRHVGKDTIYKYIYKERKDLVKYLRCQKGKYRRRYGTRIREKQREKLKKRRIDKRPEIVEQRGRIGDWEGDTIVGTDRQHILTHVERKSGVLLADKLGRGLAEITRQKTIERFNKLDSNKKYTITYDNGSSFSEHELTEKESRIVIYFANPYHSWERGSNENANGLLRQFFPKKTSFATVTQEQIEKAVKLINNRPRKRHNYATPREIFMKC